MRRVLGFRDGWAGISISKRLSLFPTRPLSTNNKPSAPSSANGVGGDKADGSLSTYEEAYRQLDKLDFMTAARMLFTTPPKKKKFGLDFHLVQLFFACMPSLAVYLVAQYARYEMRRMEAELEEKKKVEEEAKAKEIELNASKEKEDESNPELLEVKVRLEKLEVTLKEFVGESKKQLDSAASTKNQEDVSKKKNNAETIPGNTEARSEASISLVNDEDSEQKSETGAASSSQVQGSDSAHLRGTLDDGIGGTSKK